MASIFLAIVLAGFWPALAATSNRLSRNADPRRFVHHDEASADLQTELDALANPPNCRETRLLLLDFFQEEREGLGSVLGSLAAAVALSYWTNRTLVLARPPPIFAMPYRAAVHPGWCTAGIGFDCFFEPLSSCKLSDISRDEAEGLSRHPEAEGRVHIKSSAGRSNACLWTPPRKFRQLDGARDWWARQIAQRVFRQRPWLKAKALAASAILHGLPRPWAGIHVRHGDLVLDQYRGIREVYSFNKFVSALKRHHPETQTVFVASDSRKLKAAIKHHQGADPGRRYVFLEDHLRHKYGTHTLVRPISQLPIPQGVGEADKLRSVEETIATSDRILIEAVVDIWLLSSCDHIIGTGSSSFSMWANLLRPFSPNVSAPVWLDLTALASGAGPTGLLSSSHLEDRVERESRPSFRWKVVQDWFTDSHAPLPEIGAVRVRLDTRSGLPMFDYDLFDKELLYFRWHDPEFKAPCDGMPHEQVNLGLTLRSHGRNGRAYVCWSKAVEELVGMSEPVQATGKIRSFAARNLETEFVIWQGLFAENLHAFGQVGAMDSHGIYQNSKLVTILPPSRNLDDVGLTTQPWSNKLTVVVCSKQAYLFPLRQSSPFDVLNVCEEESNFQNAHQVFMDAAKNSSDLLLVLLNASGVKFRTGISGAEVHRRYHRTLSNDSSGGSIVRASDNMKLLGPGSSLATLWDRPKLLEALHDPSMRRAFSNDVSEDLFDYMIHKGSPYDMSKVDPPKDEHAHQGPSSTCVASKSQSCLIFPHSRTLTLYLNWPGMLDSAFTAVISNAELLAFVTNRSFHIETPADWIHSCAFGAGWTCWFEPTAASEPPVRALRTRYRAAPNGKAGQWMRTGSGSWQIHRRKEEALGKQPIFWEQHLELDSQDTAIVPLLESLMDGDWDTFSDQHVPTSFSRMRQQLNLSIGPLERHVNQLIWRIAPEVQSELSLIQSSWNLPRRFWAAHSDHTATQALMRHPCDRWPAAVLIIDDASDYDAISKVRSVCQIGQDQNPIMLINTMRPRAPQEGRLQAEDTLLFLAQVDAMRRGDLLFGNPSSSMVRLAQSLRDEV